MNIYFPTCVYVVDPNEATSLEESKNPEIYRESKEDRDRERAQKALEDEETLMSIEEKESNNLNVEAETSAWV